MQFLQYCLSGYLRDEDCGAVLSPHIFKVGNEIIYDSRVKMNYEDAVRKCSSIGATLVGKDAVDEVRFDDHYIILLMILIIW